MEPDFDGGGGSKGQMGSISAKSKINNTILFNYMHGLMRRKMASFRIFPLYPSIGMLGLAKNDE